MQIISWLFKGSNTRSSSHKERCSTIVEEEEEVKSRDLVLYESRDEQVELAKSTFTTILPKREDSRACFYSTLQLMRVGYIQNTWQTTTRNRGLVETRHKADAAAVGCKVLPICDIATLGSASGCRGGLGKEVQNRRRAASRMKELLKWAAAAKSGKGGSKGCKVFYLRDKMALKDPLDDASSDSRKTSFRWNVGDCSTSSVFSPMSMPLPSRSDQMGSNNVANSIGSPKSGCNKAGQWITSDSEFVVLEL